MTTQALRELREKIGAGSCPMQLAIDAIPKWSSLIIASFDGSLDAALALHEAVLPEWAMTLENDTALMWHVWVENLETVQTFGSPYLENPARAWLIAILAALIQEAGE